MYLSTGKLAGKLDFVKWLSLCFVIICFKHNCLVLLSKAVKSPFIWSETGRICWLQVWDKIRHGRYYKVCHSLYPPLQTQVYLFFSLPACKLKTPVCLWHLDCRQWLQGDNIFIPKDVVGGKGQSAASCSTSGVRLQSTKNFWSCSHKTSVSINMDIICWSQAGFETLNKAVLAGWVG